MISRNQHLERHKCVVKPRKDSPASKRAIKTNQESRTRSRFRKKKPYNNNFSTHLASRHRAPVHRSSPAVAKNTAAKTPHPHSKTLLMMAEAFPRCQISLIRRSNSQHAQHCGRVWPARSNCEGFQTKFPKQDARKLGVALPWSSSAEEDDTFHHGTVAHGDWYPTPTSITTGVHLKFCYLHVS